MVNPDAVLRELRGGRISGDALELIADQAFRVVRTGRYSTPEGSREWFHDDVQDLVADFVSDGAPLLALATSSADGSHLTSAMRTALKHTIIDRLRKTPGGRLRQRIARRIKGRDDVVDVPPSHWSFPAFKAVPHWSGGPEPLTAAAAGQPVDPPPAWSKESTRLPPATTPECVDRLCTCVLERAAAPVDRVLVCEVVAERILPTPGALETGPPVDGHRTNTGADAALMARADEEAARLVAESIWRSLSPEDRQLLAVLDLSAREAAATGVLQLGRSALHERQRRLRERLEALLDASPERALVVGALRRMSDVAADAGQQAGVET